MAIDDGGRRPHNEPLGILLVRRGVISREQLEDALAEQKTTQRPIGEIIVSRGFAPGPLIAQALATQHGGLLKTEYGFATGFAPLPSLDAPPPEELPEPAATGLRMAEDDVDDEGSGDDDGLRAELADATEQVDRLAARNAELEERAESLEQQLASHAAALEKLRAWATSAQTGIAQRDALILQLRREWDEARGHEAPVEAESQTA